jgi:hypothetical protein
MAVESWFTSQSGLFENDEEVLKRATQTLSTKLKPKTSDAGKGSAKRHKAAGSGSSEEEDEEE